MKAVLLAGGRGVRLRPLTDKIPKPMVLIGGKPIMQWQIEWLQSFGVHSFVLSVGHLSEQIRAYFGDGGNYGVEVQYIVEKEPLGTGGALRKALEESDLDGHMYVANGDVLTNLDPRQMEACRAERGVVGGICLVPLSSPYGIVEVDGDSLVRSFAEKPQLSDYWINAGVYSFAPEIQPYLPTKGSLEQDVFPALSQEGKLLARKYSGCFWRSIDSHKDIEETSERIPVMDANDG
ncbi:MAG: NDP-sugar synthase [Dehalococcoidia bacterium]